MLEVNKIYLGDCLETMKQIPDKSIDLVLTDPPYGIGEDKTKRPSRGKTPTKAHVSCDWDDKIPRRIYFDEMIRVSKNQIIFGGNYFIKYLLPNSGWIFWDKKTKSNLSDGELAYTTFKRGLKKYEFMWEGFWQENMKNKDKRVHPTQKPAELFRRILNDYSEEGQTILDPFAGSGTTAIACHDLKRNFICIEKEPEYHRIATDRYNTHKAQMTLF